MWVLAFCGSHPFFLSFFFQCATFLFPGAENSMPPGEGTILPAFSQNSAQRYEATEHPTWERGRGQAV